MPTNLPVAVDLRPWSDDDLPLLERLMGDPVMTAHLGGPETPEKIRQRHDRYRLDSVPGKEQMFVIVVGADRVAAGSIGYWEKTWQGQQILETGWSVLPEFQGQGIATQAIAVLVKRAQAEGEQRFLHAFPAIDNGPSNALCQKAGFTLQSAVDFEYPPGHLMRCHDWRLDLSPTTAPSQQGATHG